ncbi:MAG: class I SAM-dependent methyltransferase [Candidatus Latescibacteria bacterium]|nr:class I SAM-dependent methyltransferase [Candidatus Latescibacterota bacterium]
MKEQLLGRPLARAFVAQAAALGLVLLARLSGWQPDLPVLLALHGGLAVLWSAWLKLPRWWWPLQALCLPGALVLLRLELPPWIFLLLFLLLLLIYWNAGGDRVPLYLSSQATWAAVERLLPAGPVAFVDLGCGLGGLLGFLAGRRPESRFCGIESAPLPLLASWLRLRGWPNCQVRRADLWQVELGEFSVVYCFLSPEPMAELWRKARAELRPGALFISNSFAVPGVSPDLTVEVGGRQRLLVWRM